MMKIRKVLTILLTLTVLLSLVGCVNAATVDAGVGENHILVTYAVADGFTLVVPAGINLGDVNQEVTADPLQLTKFVIPDTKFLQINVSSLNGWDVVLSTRQANPEDVDKIGYKMMYTPVGGSNLVDITSDAGEEFTILKHPSGEGPVTMPISFMRTERAQKAGVFEDTLTFIVSIV